VASEPPTFSVIVPTRGREASLARCLRALARLQYPRDLYEVIVVDDGSPTPPDRVVEEAPAGMSIQAIRQEHRGPAAARNAGVRRAKGQYLAFTDDDCMPTPSWLRAFADCFAEGDVSAVGGHTRNVLRDNPCSAASQDLVDYLYSYYNNGNHATFLTSNNLAVHADVFRRVGRFDESFPLPAGEDREFVVRVVRRGYKAVYSPAAVVDHAHELGPRSFWRQHFRYGRGAFHFHRVNAESTATRIRLERPRFYFELLRRPFVRADQDGRLTAAGLLAVSQIANAAGFFFEKTTSMRQRHQR
jgi:cellulose synthase/poly-beta-1,6-N-acetylglucosamine synthase-like glycosyltransferase